MSRLSRLLPHACVAIVWLGGAASPAWSDEYTLALDGTRRMDQFGEVVSVNGETLVVGAPRRNAAYVFERRNGVWVPVVDLAPRPIHPDKRFGNAIDVLDDWIAVGATRVIGPPPNEPGTVYLYRRTSTGWQLADRVDDSNMNGFNEVHLTTDRLFAGNSRLSRIYRRLPQGVELEATLNLPANFEEGGVAFEHFDFSDIVPAGGMLLVRTTVRRITMPPQPFAPLMGRVLVYARTGSNWAPVAMLRPDAAIPELDQFRFGWNLVTDGATVLMDVPGAPVGVRGVGAFELVSSAWTRTGYFETPGFGPLDIDGNVAVAGLPSRNATHPYQGALVSFARHGTTWRQVAGPILHHDPDPDDRLGTSVAVHGQELLAGMPSDDRFPTSVENWNFGSVRVFTNVITGDEDGDGLPTGWELSVHLDPFSSAGDDGASGDPDLDGLTNAAEHAASSHPRGADRRYLAEGATGTFFDTSIALFNPSDEPAYALLSFQLDAGPPLQHPLRIPPHTRRSLTAEAVAGLSAASFSTAIEADRRLVVDRTMSWDARGYGSHAETAVAGASTRWILAEGSTAGTFRLFYLLQNPDRTLPADVTITYLRPSPLAPIVRSYRLPPVTRTTIAVNLEAGLESTDVSALIDSTGPIIVERAMYRDDEGRPLGAGHASAGVTDTALHWFLAEGATGAFFDLFVLVANPNPQPADVDVTYLLPGGGTLSKSYVIAPRSRFTIFVDDERFGSALPLANTAVSTEVRSTNGVPIVVERAMWWANGVWREAHSSPGATSTGTRWAMAGGEEGGVRNSQTYALIANTSTFGGQARVTLFFEDGASIERTYALPSSSRTNVPIGPDFPIARDKHFSILVESLGANPAQIVVERAMYSDSEGVVWAAGTNVLGTMVP